MWRRVATQLKTLATSSPWRSSFRVSRSYGEHQSLRLHRSLVSASPSVQSNSLPFQKTNPLFAQHESTDSENLMSMGKKRVEDISPIVTGHEREELEAKLAGRNILDTNDLVGPFGTKEAPAIVKSYYDKRIVGCPGGEGEDEHDVVWFWLEKGKPHECPVCTQYFQLEVVGPGGPPDGHGDDDDGH